MTIDDARMVMWCADMLEKSEFEVFEMAYQAWYRETPDTTRLERIFVAYMFSGVAPFWVRQFTRSTARALGDAPLDDDTEVWAYVVRCSRAAASTIAVTFALAVRLFLPRMAFPDLDAEPRALPA